MQTVDSPPAKAPTRPRSDRDPNSHRRHPRTSDELRAALREEMERLRSRVEQLEAKLDGRDLGEMERKLDEVSDRAWTAVTRATVTRTELDRTIDRLNDVRVRLRGVC